LNIIPVNLRGRGQQWFEVSPVKKLDPVSTNNLCVEAYTYNPIHVRSIDKDGGQRPVLGKNLRSYLKNNCSKKRLEV
jgi:hypothetical protein